MKNVKSLLLLVASAALLSACGNNPTPASSSVAPVSSESQASESSVEYTGSSRNVAVDFAANANLVGCSVIAPGYTPDLTYRYTPKSGAEFYLVPSFIGANELDYVTIDGIRYNAEVGTSDLKFKDNSGANEMSLAGVRYAKVVMPEGAKYSVADVKVYSRAVTGATLHTVTINATNSTDITVNTYIGSVGTITAQFIEGSYASFTIEGVIQKDAEGEDYDTIENWHGKSGAAAACTVEMSANVEGVVVSHNTLEGSIRNFMRTSGNFVVPSSDVTVNVTYAKAAVAA